MGSEDDAQKLVDQRHQDYTAPCPHVCTVDASEFEVSGIPDAKGMKRASQPGHEGEPFEAYEVEFADGDFVYIVNVAGEPGSVEQRRCRRRGAEALRPRQGCSASRRLKIARWPRRSITASARPGSCSEPS
jgi:hypothetical protein